MPPHPPHRTVAANYHFHTYDYPGSGAVGKGPWALSPAQPQRGGLQFYSMRRDLTGLLNEGGALNVPNIALNSVGGQTFLGKNTLELSFGNLGNVANLPTVVITGGIHAREWIAAEIAYLIAEYLIVNYVAGGPPANPRAAQLQNLVNGRNIRIIPMLNPDGNNRTVFGAGANNRMWRKNLRPLPAGRQAWVTALAPGGPALPTAPFRNVQAWFGPIPRASYEVPDYDPAHGIPPGVGANYRRHVLYNNETGVDLNRNMATTAWGYDCAPRYSNFDPESDTYFGTGPGTEAETSNVQQAMAAAVNIDVAIDYHSYSRMILYPSEAFHAGLGAAHTRVGQMLQALILDQAGQGYQLGDPLHLIHYDATGSVADYAAQAHQARAFTIELDPATQAQGGFQLPENQIQGVFEANIRGALAAIAAPASLLETQQATARYLAWNVHGQGNRVP